MTGARYQINMTFAIRPGFATPGGVDNSAVRSVQPNLQIKKRIRC
ncbi:MAG: hypothetical protein SWZ49_02775 [Cyanobacteriota bacterium]|nr:hypothetical protein [Cyanobacteriota bacterium]